MSARPVSSSAALPPEVAGSEAPEPPTLALRSLPIWCYAFLASRRPGNRVVTILAGVRGFFPSDLDNEKLSDAVVNVWVDRLNLRLGVSDQQQQAMLAGAMHGFHVPIADPNHPWHHRSFDFRAAPNGPPTNEIPGVVEPRPWRRGTVETRSARAH